VNAARYVRLFGEAGLAGRVVLPVEPVGRRHIFHQFVIRVPARDELKRYLDEQGIGCEVYYPVPFHRQPCFEGLGYRASDFPQAERAAAEALAIPIYGELSLDDQRAVVEAIGSFVRARASD
jgi:dTDP-4-amino-4,6-dideoxygalactose transaminase